MPDVPPESAVVWRNRAMTLFDRIPMPIAVCDVYGAIILANPAMAAEWGATPGGLRGRDVLDLFQPQEATQVERIAQALRLRHRSRYQISVRWRTPGGTERYGELTADPVSDTVDATTTLLVLLRVLGEHEPKTPTPTPAEPPATPAEARILALLEGGATTAHAALETGLTVDGVNYLPVSRRASPWSSRSPARPAVSRPSWTGCTPDGSRRLGPVRSCDLDQGAGRGACDRKAPEGPRSGATRTFRQRGERACHAPRAQITTPNRP